VQRVIPKPESLTTSWSAQARIRNALIEAGLLDTRTAQGRNAA